jgi:hypothetical protein
MKVAAITCRARSAAAPVRAGIPVAIALAALALAGCSPSLAAPGPATTTAASSSPASVVSSAPATATPTPAPAASTPAAAPAATAPTATASPSQPAGYLTAKVTLLGAKNGLVPGGSRVRFLVTVTNGSAQTYQDLLPLVSLGHCSCTANTLFPSGTLQERASTSDFWQTIPYDIEGFGTDYLSADEPGGIQMLSPGGIATFEYRVSLSPATSAQVTRGTASIDVTLEALPRHAVIGRAPAASAAIDIQSGQPPA